MKGLVLSDNGIKIAEGRDYWAARLERLLFTPEGGILGAPDWGSRIPNEFLFEPEDETSANEIINEIGFLFESREPEMQIESAEVNLLGTNSGQTGLAMSVGVTTPESGVNEEVIKFFKIIEIT